MKLPQIAPVHPLKQRISIMREILNDAEKYVNKGSVEMAEYLLKRLIEEAKVVTAHVHRLHIAPDEIMINGDRYNLVEPTKGPLDRITYKRGN